MGKTVVYCGDCRKQLYSIDSIKKDQASQCPYCKSTEKFYLTIGAVKIRGLTHTANMLKKDI